VKLFKFAKQVLGGYSEAKAGVLSAAFAYFTIFAIAPLLLVIISIVGFFLGEKAANGQLFSQISDIVGPAAARTIQNAITHTHESGAGTVALIVGIFGTILAAVGLANQLQNAFDTIFDVVPDPKSGLKRTIYTKLKNLVLLAGTGLVVIASVVLSTVVSALGHRLRDHFGVPAVAVESLNTVASFIIFVAILYLIYKVLPDVFIPKKIVLTASITVSLMFVVGKIVLGVIIGKNATASAYGAAASLIVLLLWFYYTAQILLLGAEGIKVYGDNRALVYKAKKYTLKRHSIDIDIKNGLAEKLIRQFSIGFKKRSNKK
jgi:membrane protein